MADPNSNVKVQIKSLENDKEKLIADNVNLINENDALKAKYFDLENNLERKLLKLSNQEMKKQNEIQQHLENRLQAAQ